MKFNMEKEKGFINVYIDTQSENIICSKKPYKTKEDADKNILVSIGIEKLGCYEIEYTKCINNTNESI